ncbi:peroxiredoxin [Neisseria arctica]|uniref:Peroxiredoxin n=1 Tax=Neisseria arctica TaxID=1470200 RepID=A0A0J0YU02_9NEIS|nr:OsmC family protein [Neisseria arctica]KLT73580.1 peroxiredoxin [Neisseria arctica]UOO85700.1 OsmC family protein [Neisseria arctica]
MKQHKYLVNIRWEGNLGVGTENYRSYSRDFCVFSAAKKNEIKGSSDPSFLGDTSKWNPEEMLVAAISSCHKLWYLHLCAINNIIVIDYIDSAEGLMVEHKVEEGVSKFEEVTLNPVVTITQGSDLDKASKLHDDAHKECFLANSINFPVKICPKIIKEE